MPKHAFKRLHTDPRIHYRGATPSRLDTLTDAVFGIAITLLIFTLSNPNSFGDLLLFTKTLPAFLVSITFVLLVWSEHTHFSEVYTLDDTWISWLNTFFLALVIFYVYPLRFLTLFLTNTFFSTDIEVRITYDQVPLLMIYYALVVIALYSLLFLMYTRALHIREILHLSPFEVWHTRMHRIRIGILGAVPIVSILITLSLKAASPQRASLCGGLTYFLYGPLMGVWYTRYTKGALHND